MAQNIKIENLAAAVMEELTAYSNEVSEDLKEAIKATAKECVADIKQAAPVPVSYTHLRAHETSV